MDHQNEFQVNNLAFYANALKWFISQKFEPALDKNTLHLLKDGYKHFLNKLDIDYFNNTSEGIVKRVVDLYSSLGNVNEDYEQYPYFFLATSNAQQAFLIEDVTKQMAYYKQKLEKNGISELWKYINHNELEHRLVVASMIEWEELQES